MQWTEERISKWALDTFGPASILGVACRANVEMAELLREIEGQERVLHIALEAADVMIVLARVAVLRSIDFFTLARGRRDQVHLGESLVVRDIARRANVSLAQVIYHCDRETQGALCEAMALLGARLAVLCEVLGYDLWELVDKKMGVNEKREWTLDGNGHGQHVPGTGD